MKRNWFTTILPPALWIFYELMASMRSAIPVECLIAAANRTTQLYEAHQKLFPSSRRVEREDTKACPGLLN